MKKIIKLFWSLNIIKIEKMLNSMANKGYILKNVNTITRIFTFEKNEPKNLTYKICYGNKRLNDISPSLKREGWKEVCRNYRWLFICNENNIEEININPSRELLLRRNKIIKNILTMIILTYLFLYGPTLLILGFSYLGAVHGMIFTALIFGIFIVMKFNKLDKEIRLEDNISEIKVEEYNNNGNGKIIRKIKLGWFYSPDKTENWLDEMESKGYNLQRIHKIGTIFYFRKGQPRKIKYIADYKNITNETYYEIHSEDGWDLRFKSLGGFMNWCIWSKEYNDEKPEIYTDNNDKLSYAKKILITNTLMFIPVILIYSYIIIIQAIYNKSYLFSSSNIIQYIVLLEFSMFYKNIVGYYFRTKKKVSDISI